METTSKEKPGLKGKYLILAVFIVLALFILIIMALNSRKPDRITLGSTDKSVKGSAFIKTNQILIKQMYKNWLPNDLFWPTVLLDNTPNFQIGELEVVRYNIRVLRDNLSRMRTTDKLDPAIEKAFTSLSNDPYKWLFPSAEGKLKEAHKNLEIFYNNLLSKKAFFYPRADNLIQLLNEYASLMGGANTRLINAPRDIKEGIIIDEEGKDKSEEPKTMVINIPWTRVDDNFYYTQGVSYVLYESFRAIRIDFYDVLTDKNSLRLVDKIIESLRRCYFEPMVIFNGDPESIFANHSLNLSGVFNDARQKINSLIMALDQG